MHRQYIVKKLGNDCDEKAAKVVGISIDESWKYYIAHIEITIFMKRVKTILYRDNMRTLYFALSTFPLFLWFTCLWKC